MRMMAYKSITFEPYRLKHFQPCLRHLVSIISTFVPAHLSIGTFLSPSFLFFSLFFFKPCSFCVCFFFCKEMVSLKGLKRSVVYQVCSFCLFFLFILSVYSFCLFFPSLAGLSLLMPFDLFAFFLFLLFHSSFFV